MPSFCFTCFIPPLLLAQERRWYTQQKARCKACRSIFVLLRVLASPLYTQLAFRYNRIKEFFYLTSSILCLLPAYIGSLTSPSRSEGQPIHTKQLIFAQFYIMLQAADWALGSPISFNNLQTALCLFCTARSKGVLVSASRALHNSSLFVALSRNSRMTYNT